MDSDSDFLQLDQKILVLECQKKSENTEKFVYVNFMVQYIGN